jgi:hypothetical protein
MAMADEACRIEMSLRIANSSRNHGRWLDGSRNTPGDGGLASSCVEMWLEVGIAELKRLF